MNPRKSVGKVTEVERNEIKILFERKNGLVELAKSITEENIFLYERIVKDMGETSTKLQQWWDEKSKTYKWENIKGYNWIIDFNTCEIFLEKN